MVERKSEPTATARFESDSLGCLFPSDGRRGTSSSSWRECSSSWPSRRLLRCILCIFFSVEEEAGKGFRSPSKTGTRQRIPLLRQSKDVLVLLSFDLVSLPACLPACLHLSVCRVQLGSKWAAAMGERVRRSNKSLKTTAKQIKRRRRGRKAQK